MAKLRNINCFRMLFAAALLVPLPGFADENVASETKLAKFKANHPNAQFQGSQYFDGEGFFHERQPINLIYGTTLAHGKTAQLSVRSFCQQIDGIYADEIGQLKPRVFANGTDVQSAMWDAESNTHRFSVLRFDQEINGVPVFRSGIGFLVRNDEDFPVVMSANNLKELKGFDGSQLALQPVFVTEQMKRNAAAAMAAPNFNVDGHPVQHEKGVPEVDLPVVVSKVQPVVWAGNSNVRVNPEMAVQFVATQGDANDFVNYRRYLIVAATDDGEVLHAESRILADINGSVAGKATVGESSIPCSDPVAVALPYAEVSIEGGDTVFADGNGDFSIPGVGPGEVTVKSPLKGLYFDVFDFGRGGSTPELSMTTTAPGSVDFLHNSNDEPFGTAAVNAYVYANTIRDFVLAIEPEFPVAADELNFEVNVNDDSFICNAFYDPDIPSINFFRRPIFGCTNTAVPGIVAHEYGHHLIWSSGLEQAGQFHEGAADTLEVLLQGSPDVGRGFYTEDCSTPIRSAENFREYPCIDQFSGHDCGQLLSGCVWDTVQEIEATGLANARDVVANLFVNMLIVRGAMGAGPDIGPEVAAIFIELDDDDADLSNGTPNFAPIMTAFAAHNMQPVDLLELRFSFPNGLPESVDPSGGTAFVVDVQSNGMAPTADSGLLHVNTGSGFEAFPMSTLDDDSFTAEFPSVPCGTEVSFFVSVENSEGELTTWPPFAPSSRTFTTVSHNGIANLFRDDFSSDKGWTTSSTAPRGRWERGNNELSILLIGEPGADSDGSGDWFGTEFDVFPDVTLNTDVDAGSTTLTSPVLDASSAGNSVVQFSFDVWFVGFADEDSLLIEVSNDGGVSWVVADEIDNGVSSWSRHSIVLNPLLQPTSELQIRFVASDAGENNLVEAAIDAFSMDLLSCPSVLLGDINTDGVVNLFDVQPFVSLITGDRYQVEGDVNQDGAVNLLDIAPFVDLLTSG